MLFFFFAAVKTHTNCLTELGSHPFLENVDNKTCILRQMCQTIYSPAYRNIPKATVTKQPEFKSWQQCRCFHSKGEKKLIWMLHFDTWIPCEQQNEGEADLQSTERNSHRLRDSYHISLSTAVTHLSHLQQPQPTSYPMANLYTVCSLMLLHRGVTLSTGDPTALSVTSIREGKKKRKHKAAALPWAACDPVLIGGTVIPTLAILHLQR